jgi:hypothetical protein
LPSNGELRSLLESIFDSVLEQEFMAAMIRAIPKWRMMLNTQPRIGLPCCFNFVLLHGNYLIKNQHHIKINSLLWAETQNLLLANALVALLSPQ